VINKVGRIRRTGSTIALAGDIAIIGCADGDVAIVIFLKENIFQNKQQQIDTLLQLSTSYIVLNGQNKQVAHYYHPLLEFFMFFV
jgi:hypothetical protein